MGLIALQNKIVWVVKRKNKNLFGNREKQNFCERIQDASLPL